MIAQAIQRGSYVYDEKPTNHLYRSGKLVGYTATSLSIQRDSCIFVYDDKDRCLYYRSN